MKPRSKAAAKRKTGRPSTYTEKLADRILAALIDGQSLRSICSASGMPWRGTVIRWMDTNVDFRNRYARAREAQADTMDDLILDTAMKTTSANAAANRVKIDALKWRAAHLKPRKYGSKLEHTGPGGGPIQTVDLTNATDDDLDRLEALLARIAVAGGGSGGEAAPGG